MKCPLCGRETTVAETRAIGHYIRRRRHCVSESCAARLTTAEIIVAANAPAGRPLGDVLIVPRRDIERVLISMAQALASRLGSFDVLKLVESVLHATHTTEGQDHGNDHGTGNG